MSDFVNIIYTHFGDIKNETTETFFFRMFDVTISFQEL